MAWVVSTAWLSELEARACLLQSAWPLVTPVHPLIRSPQRPRQLQQAARQPSLPPPRAQAKVVGGGGLHQVRRYARCLSMVEGAAASSYHMHAVEGTHCAQTLPGLYCQCAHLYCQAPRWYCWTLYRWRGDLLDTLRNDMRAYQVVRVLCCTAVHCTCCVDAPCLHGMLGADAPAGHKGAVTVRGQGAGDAWRPAGACMTAKLPTTLPAHHSDSLTGLVGSISTCH
jgi:hypothetical protein